jgi:hypothetical protein
MYHPVPGQAASSRSSQVMSVPSADGASRTVAAWFLIGSPDRER